ncbi:hypothetical protein AYO44_09250 [Planctomycetaceae bacterium SCGC AG-212-F19]|nr:hypothetical protein AYO44_09250 [Planctomycetaceae bacterium SCGC AG-212-F19]
MALFWGQECPLCGIKMTTSDRLFATSHFLGPASDLWQFSDAVMALLKDWQQQLGDKQPLTSEKPQPLGFDFSKVPPAKTGS